MTNPQRPRTAKRALLGTLKAVAVLLVIGLGAYALFSGAFFNDRHAAEALERDHVLVGASLGTWPTDGNPAIQDFESKTGVRLDLVDVFLDWYTPYHNVSHTVEHIMDRGSIPILSWEAHGFTTPEIIAGEKTTWLRDGRSLSVEDYLEEFAEGACKSAKTFRMPLLLRTLHEFNGSWFTWGISHVTDKGVRPNSDESYKAAWVRLHDIFRSHCGSEILFVWSVNHFSTGEGATFTGPFPGDDYVDFIGLDGYNWGTKAPWGWQSFETIFDPSYCAVARVSSKPILLAEISSSESGGSKAEWIRDVLGKFQHREYPGLQGFVWFNDHKYEIEIQGEMDWPVDSSPSSLAAFSKETKALLAERERGGAPPAGQGEPPC